MSIPSSSSGTEASVEKRLLNGKKKKGLKTNYWAGFRNKQTTVLTVRDPNLRIRKIIVLSCSKIYSDLGKFNADTYVLEIVSILPLPESDLDFLPIQDPGSRGSKRHRIPDPDLKHCSEESSNFKKFYDLPPISQHIFWTDFFYDQKITR
jgi:hypothetical protein